MSADQISDETLTDYLLGALPEEEARRVEESYFADDELEDRLADAERDLIDSYVKEELSGERRSRFEQRFLTSEARLKKLAFAKALHAHQSTHGKLIRPSRPLLGWLVLSVKTGEFSRSAVLRVAAILLVASAAAFVLFSISSNQNNVKEGLQALGEAYKNQRPSQYRISGLPYAPADVVRGETSNGDSRYRELAERLLTNAVAKHPDAESHDALGRLYMAEGRTDDSINEFKAALNSSGADSAQVYSDLGAALLQKSDQLRPRPNGEGSAPEKRALEEALDALNRALEADPNFADAIFNRALCYEKMGSAVQARSEWERYLKVDPNSGWALEAKEHIRHIDEAGK